MTAEDQRVQRLKEHLRALEAHFDAEARKRGFDPAQAENMALPSNLAVLFAECEEIRTELEELAEINQEK